MVNALLLVLLLPGPLEDFELRTGAEALAAEPAGVAVEPPRVSSRALGRLPDVLGAVAAGMQAKRMRLPGTPRLVVLFDGLQYPLARALVARHQGCELVYVPASERAVAVPGGERHALASERAVAVLDRDGDWRAELLERAAAAGVEVSRRPSAGAG